LVDWRVRVEEAEEKLTIKFERWLSRQSRERLEAIIRRVWEMKGLRLIVLPYNEILGEGV